MKPAAVGCALALMAIPAGAQTTTCLAGAAGMTTCNTIPAYAPAAAGADPISLVRSIRIAQRKSAAAKLIAHGRCTEARQYALEQGDLDLALSVQKLCATPSQQAVGGVIGTP